MIQRFIGSIIIFTVFLLLLHSCEKEQFANECEGYSASIYNYGNTSADGSYKNFDGYAIFARERELDTINGGWKHDELRKGFAFTEINDFCIEKVKLIIKNIAPSISDTFNILYNLSGPVEFPTAYLFYLDGDALLDSYILLEAEEIKNWLVLDEINADTTIISGRFQLSFVSAYDREKSDDPNRPDTLHFTNGAFTAEFAPF